jgi:peptide/nickel transport system permease protein
MQRYILGRLLSAIPTLLGITILIFLAVRILPGDPVQAMLAGDGMGGVVLSEDEIKAARKSLGLDRPLTEQYWAWIADILRGEMGKSFWRDEPVRDLILRRAPISIEIAIFAILISWLIGLPVGILSAMQKGKAIDTLVRVITIIFLAIPSFWSAMLLLLYTVTTFLWRPPITAEYLWKDPGQNLQIVAGPAIVLGLAIAAIMARFTRSSMLEVLGQDYVRTAHAKGLNLHSVIWPHTLKNAMLPVITISGLMIGGLLGGSIAVERAFGVPGLGSALVRAISERDWMVIQNLVLLYGVFFTLVNLAVDISYSWFDPRIRYGQ